MSRAVPRDTVKWVINVLCLSHESAALWLIGNSQAEHLEFPSVGRTLSVEADQGEVGCFRVLRFLGQLVGWKQREMRKIKAEDLILF